MKHASWILPALAAMAALASGVSVIRSQPRRPPTEPPSPPPAAGFPDRIAAVGTVEAGSENIAVGSPLSGLVVAVPARVGSAVQAGDPLFTLDTRALGADRGAREASVRLARRRAATASTILADVEDQLRRAEQLAQTDVISPDDLERRRFAVRTAAARQEEAGAEVDAAEAALKVVETELERSVIRSPIAGEVLQVNVRPGEFATAGSLVRPLIVLGSTRPLSVRVDVDEHEGWRVRNTAAAEAQLRGDSRIRTPLRFLRVEPMVVPKRSLSGDATERVDTRVLQVLYTVAGDAGVPLYVGQQLDVFIAATP